MNQAVEQQPSAPNNEQMLQFFLQLPTPLALMLGPEHIFSLANAPYCELVGRNPLGRAVREVFSENEAGAFFGLLDQVYQTGLPYAGKELPFTRVSSDGSSNNFFLDIVYRPYRDKGDQVIGILAFVYDVTEQVQLRRKAEASEFRLRSIFSHAAVGFSIATLDGQLLEVNQRFCEITGYSQSEIQNLLIADLIYPDDRLLDAEGLRALIDGSTPHPVIEERFIQKNGAIAWVRNSISLVQGSSGEKLVIRVSEDVTDVREAERERQASENRYGLLADSMPQIVWTAGPDGMLNYFNKVWFDYSGTIFDENVGSGWAQAVHPDDIGRTLELWANSLKTGEIYENEFRLRSALGEYRWFVVRAVPAKDHEGQVMLWYGTNTDIHQSKILSEQLALASHELESEQQKFRTIIADSSASIAVLKGERLVYEIANRSYLELFNNRELIGKDFTDALPELKDQEFPRIAKAVFETGTPYVDREARAFLKRTADGPLEERFFDQTYTQMLDQEGKAYGVFIHAQEVTDRVKSRVVLEETAERLRLAIDVANMGTWEIDPLTKDLVLSERSIEILGVAVGERLQVEDALNIVHPEDRQRVQEAIEAAMDPTGSGDYNIQHRILRPDGVLVWASLLGKSFFVETSQGRIVGKFTGIILDVTQKVLAEAELLAAKERAEAANSAKSGFLANMSHEIRTPIGAIMGFVSLIKDEELTQDMLLEYVSVIERNSIQLLRIIDDILDLSKVEAGMLMIEHIDFSLIEMLSDFASLMGFKAREKGILFELKAKTKLPVLINGDPTRIRQILTNVVGNAIKFTDKGSVTLWASYSHGFVEFEVIDTGRGISAEQIANLFQPFSQADASVTRKYGGTGLGLVLTRRLSEAMGGSFELKESVPNRGSAFVSRVKADVTAGATLVKALGFTPEVNRIPVGQGQLQNLHILLVEDSPDNQTLYTVYLVRAGAHVDIAADGLKGYEMALAGGYDVILMDVQMPLMDGITAVKKLRADGYAGPIIALTAHAMKEEVARCLQAGFDAFLAKPIHRAELIELIQDSIK